METVGFKKQSGDPSFTNFSAIVVVPDYDVDATMYSDINDNLRKNVDVYRKVWHITFARLDVTAQNFLIDLKAEEAPQMQYSSTTYNIRVKSLNSRHVGAKITVARVESE
jgi:hypothetical protein